MDPAYSFLVADDRNKGDCASKSKNEKDGGVDKIVLYTVIPLFVVWHY